eukprot:gene23421-28353_t
MARQHRGHPSGAEPPTRWLGSTVGIGPEEDGIVPPRRQNLSEMDHPRGGEKDSWWTLMVPRPMDDLSVVPLKVRSIEVLLKIVDYRYACHKKSVQLAAGTLWNLAVRSLAVEHLLLSNGLCGTLLRLVINEGNVWEPMVRDTAAAFLGELMEEWTSVELIGGMKLVQEGLVKLVGTQVPRLQAIGLRVLGHMTFKAPMSCPNPGRAIMATKTIIVEAKIVAKMVSILNMSLKVAFESLQTPRVNGEMEDKDFDSPSDDEIGHMPMILHTLRLMLNISVMEQHQVHIARLVMMPLLRLVPHFAGMLQSHHTSAKTKNLARKIADTTNAVLQNVAAHPENRTRFYKVELQGVTAAQLDEDQHRQLSNRSSSPSRACATRSRRLPAITPKKGAMKTPASDAPKTVQSLDFERLQRPAGDSSTETTHRSLDRLDGFSTVTTEVSPEELSRLMEQIYATRVPEVVEHLMVTLWVLMRNPNLQAMMQGAPPAAMNDGKCDIEDEALDRSRAANKALEEMIGVESNLDDIREEEKTDEDEEKKKPVLSTEEVAQKERERLIELEERNNWGLKVLLGVAERWVDEVGQEDGTSEDSVCLTKMVEFMVACFWLYLI